MKMTVKKDRDFERFGILSLDGETIQRLTISANTFQEVPRQRQFP